MARTRSIPAEALDEINDEAMEDAIEEVQEETPVPSLPKWQFIGGGTLALKDGRFVESGSFFTADASAISPAFMDLMRLIEPGTVKPKYDDSEILDVKLSKREDGLFDVKAGSVILNEEPLSKIDAKAFIKTLSTE